MITRAMKSEEVKTIINVIGMYDINSPIILRQKSSGTKAASVVAVDEIIGIATSPVACFAASITEYPLSTNRCMFSVTTIALSTSIPNARINEKRTIILMR